MWFTILAQNRLQPLSGNRYILSFLFVMLFSFCAETKPAYTNKSVIEIPEIKVEKEFPQPNKAVEANKKDDSKTLKQFNVSLLLPLFLSEVQAVETVNDSVPKIPQVNKSATLGIELYEGVKFALDSLAAESGNSFIINIADTKQNEEELKTILASPNFYSADLVIGPIYNSLLKIAAAQAKKYNIPLVSPFSPAENLTENNERFFMVNPGIKTHLSTIAQYAATQFSNDNILVIRQGNDKDLATTFKQVANGKLNYKELIYTYGKYNDAANKDVAIDLKSRLKSNSNNVIIVPSIDLQFAHKLSRELYSLTEEFPIVVIGLPIWSPENDLRLDYLEKINTHFTQAAFVVDSFLHNATIANRFFEIYGHYPNENNFKGFDIGNYFGKLLIAEGKDFYKNIEQYNIQGIHTTFNFKSSYSDGNLQEETKFLYFENKQVHLFRLENFELKKLK